jgi:hypothetical protein
VSIVTELTLQKLTPTGYFNLLESAPAKHKDYMTWFKQQLDFQSDISVQLKALVLTPWLIDFNDAPRAPYVNHLLTTYGFGFYSGTNNQAAALYKLISGAWDKSLIANVKRVLDTFCLPPFSWFAVDLLPRIYSGILVPAITDTGFLMYTTAASPATPADTPYTNRVWVVPSGWTRAASSAVNYCRGYLVGSNIKWCAPRPVSDFSNETYFSATLPLAVPTAGTLCIVLDDGTNDKNAVYYSDGTAWRKNSMTNVNLGLVPLSGERPDPEAIAVWAPNPSSVTYSISSAIRPPADGNSEGYGTFAGWADIDVVNNELKIRLEQIAGGDLAIATVLAVMRRIKPLQFKLTVSIDNVDYEVSDARIAP